MKYKVGFIGCGNMASAIIGGLKAHAGIDASAGTSNYTFIWGMGGENLKYSDKDEIKYIDMK